MTFNSALVMFCIGLALLKKLAAIWTQFYTSILPTLQAMFAPVQVLANSYALCSSVIFWSFCSVGEPHNPFPLSPHIQRYSTAKDKDKWYSTTLSLLTRV